MSEKFEKVGEYSSEKPRLTAVQNAYAVTVKRFQV
jgi:hypothetical protein